MLFFSTACSLICLLFRNAQDISSSGQVFTATHISLSILLSSLADLLYFNYVSGVYFKCGEKKKGKGGCFSNIELHSVKCRVLNCISYFPALAVLMFHNLQAAFLSF